MTLYDYKMLFVSVPFPMEWKVTIGQESGAVAQQKARAEIHREYPTLKIGRLIEISYTRRKGVDLC